jgi:hypothetical protein
MNAEQQARVKLALDEARRLFNLLIAEVDRGTAAAQGNDMGQAAICARAGKQHAAQIDTVLTSVGQDIEGPFKDEFAKQRDALKQIGRELDAMERFAVGSGPLGSA